MAFSMERRSAELNVSHQLNFQRTLWEEEIREKARKQIAETINQHQQLNLNI